MTTTIEKHTSLLILQTLAVHRRTPIHELDLSRINTDAWLDCADDLARTSADQLLYGDPARARRFAVAYRAARGIARHPDTDRGPDCTYLRAHQAEIAANLAS